MTEKSVISDGIDHEHLVKLNKFISDNGNNAYQY